MRIGNGGVRPDDLTARARIRDAAMALFAEGGYGGTSIREVARVAGVSPGLVQHHFGSKDGLREACDFHARELLRASTERKLARQEYDADFISSLYESGQDVIRYVVRGLTEGWPGVGALFDQAVGDTTGWLSSTWPDRFPEGSRQARLHAAVLTSMSLGTLVLHEHVARWAGVDPLERGQNHVASAAMLELFERMAEFLETDVGRSMKSALADYRRSLPGSGEGDGDG
jgi:TetR/AcrR family transcriptional regulator, regulator of cefoperazone and chloramphenicol sensitivity